MRKCHPTPNLEPDTCDNMSEIAAIRYTLRVRNFSEVHPALWETGNLSIFEASPSPMGFRACGQSRIPWHRIQHKQNREQAQMGQRNVWLHVRLSPLKYRHRISCCKFISSQVQWFFPSQAINVFDLPLQLNVIVSARIQSIPKKSMSQWTTYPIRHPIREQRTP